MECVPRFGYGAEPGEWSGGELGEAVAEGADGTRLLLTSDMELSVSETAVRGTLHLREDETGFCAVSWGEGELGGPRSAPEALERLDSTEEFWRSWLRDGDFPDHPWRIHLQRSALVLKGLTYTPSGRDRRGADDLAAGDPGRRTQLGLPLQLDPRLDLLASGRCTRSASTQEARDFMRFILEVCRKDPNLQIMYGIGGEKDLDEKTLDHLDGYGGARPVRIGNGAYDQRQHDVWGALLDSIYLHEKALRGIGHAGRPQTDRANRSRRRSPPGPSPTRGSGRRAASPKHYVSSKLMIWVAVDRGARLARGGRAATSSPTSGSGPPTGSTRRSSSAAAATASSASTTRPTPSTPRRC